jgi:hypothetical protein
MEGLGRDLMVGVAGSVIGAVLISLFSFTRATWRVARDREVSDWKSGDQLKRQRIFNFYLFSVLKYFIIGSILIGVASAISDLDSTTKFDPLTNLDYLIATLDGAGVLFYLATFSRILRFTKLLKFD